VLGVGLQNLPGTLALMAKHCTRVGMLLALSIGLARLRGAGAFQKHAHNGRAMEFRDGVFVGLATRLRRPALPVHDVPDRPRHILKASRDQPNGGAATPKRPNVIT